MKTRLSLPSAFLVFGGFILMGLGLYFIFLRPALLPEDPRFMGTSLDQIQSLMPDLLIWLRRASRDCAGRVDFHWLDGGCQSHDQFRFQMVASCFQPPLGHSAVSFTARK